MDVLGREAIRLTEQVNVRLTAFEKRQLRALAAWEGLSMSLYVRRLVLECIRHDLGLTEYAGLEEKRP